MLNVVQIMYKISMLKHLLERLGGCHDLLELILVYWFGLCLVLALLSCYLVEF